jgi:hypothetical protein
MRNKAKLIKKINEICNCDKNQYCLLKEILSCSHNDPRFFIQIKVIEMFKWEQSEKIGKDIGWDEAHKEWVCLGYARKFAEIYADAEADSEENEVSAEEIYKKIISE